MPGVRGDTPGLLVSRAPLLQQGCSWVMMGDGCWSCASISTMQDMGSLLSWWVLVMSAGVPQSGGCWW